MSELALLGGSKAVTLDYETLGNRSMITEAGIEKANELMRKGQISSAPVVKELEDKFGAFIGTQYNLCASNGTSSIQEALFACGVSPGDEVLAPSYTYWASCVPIVACGAKVVFCEVNPDTFNIDVACMEGRVTPRTKAIVLTHVWGTPCDMEPIMAFAHKHGLAVIEDASHAHGATYHGTKIGAWGHAGCFSLQGSKILVAGEGGILTTNSREIYERALALGHYEKLENLPAESAYKQYLLTGLSHKFRIHPLGAAIANAGFDIMEERNALRNRNALYLEEGIKDIACLVPQKQYANSEKQYSYHFMRYMPELNDGITTVSLVRAMCAEGMQAGLCGYGRLHKAPLFLSGIPYGSGPSENRSDSVELPITDMLAKTTFMIAPRFETECNSLIDQYIEAVHKIFRNKDALMAYNKENPGDEVYNQISSRSINTL